MAYQDLDELLGLIGKSVKQALEAVDSYSVRSFLQYFDVPPDMDLPSFDIESAPRVKPKTVSVPIPNADGVYQSKDIPLVALINHSSLSLEDIRIRFRVALATGDESEKLRAEIGPSSLARKPLPPKPTGPHAPPSFEEGTDPQAMSFGLPTPGGGEAEPQRSQEPPSFAEVEVQFKRGEAPEGVARIVREYYKHI